MDQIIVPKYKVGDLLTFIYMGIKEDTIPTAWYILKGIEPFWYAAQLDYQISEPKALFMENVTYKTGSTFYVAPSRMRHLTEKEVALVNLSHTQAQGNA